MSEKIIVPLRLTIISFVSVLLLSIVNIFTSAQIAKASERKNEETYKFLFPDGVTFTKKEIKDSTKEFYVIVKDKSNNQIGYIVNVYGNGFGGEMQLMVAFNNDLSIKNIKMLKNNETSGFGKKWEKQKAMDMFVGSNTKEYPFPQNKNMVKDEFKDGPNGVTGATITFNGIVEAVNRAIKYLKSM